MARSWTPEEVEALRQRRLAGEKLKDIGAELGLTRERVRQLVGNCGHTATLVKIGAVFGRLTVIAEAPLARNGARQALCRCECGTEKIVRCASLRSGGTKSCGCLHREVIGVKRRFATIDGRTQCRRAWSVELGIPECTISLRLRKGLTLEEALTWPLHARYARKERE